MSPCYPFRPIPGQCGPHKRGPLPAPPFDPQDYWATRKLVSSLFGTLDTTKLDKVDVVDPSTATEDGKAADAKSTYEELTRISRMASDARVLAESKADKAAPSAANNLASLTADGNLADSGKTVGDFLPRVSNEPVRSTFDLFSPLFMDMEGYIRLGFAGFIYGSFDNIREEMGSPSSLRTELDSKADKAAKSTAGNLAALTADGNLADSEVPATRVPTAAKQLEWDGKRDRTDLSLDTWIAGEGAPESITGQPQWNEILECWVWDWNTPGGVHESFRTWNESSPDDPGPIELYDEFDIMSGRYFTATRDRIAKESQLTSKADRSMISATNSTFSNAVLAVGLNIDTNSVAVLNEIAATFGGFPIEGTATTVVGLLAALAAAAAWLKKNKVQTLKLNDNSVETSADGGVAKLDDFFTESTEYTGGLPTPTGKLKNDKLDQAVQIVLGETGGEDEKTQTVFREFAKMDGFTKESVESDSFDIAITKLSQLLGEDITA